MENWRLNHDNPQCFSPPGFSGYLACRRHRVGTVACRRAPHQPRHPATVHHHQHRELGPAQGPAPGFRTGDRPESTGHLGGHRQGAGTGKKRGRRRNPGTCPRIGRQVRARWLWREPQGRDVQRLHHRRPGAGPGGHSRQAGCAGCAAHHHRARRTVCFAG